MSLIMTMDWGSSMLAWIEVDVFELALRGLPLDDGLEGRFGQAWLRHDGGCGHGLVLSVAGGLSYAGCHFTVCTSGLTPLERFRVGVCRCVLRYTRVELQVSD